MKDGSYTNFRSDGKFDKTFAVRGGIKASPRHFDV